MVDLMMMMMNGPISEDEQQLAAAFGLLGSLVSEEDKPLGCSAFAANLPLVDSEEPPRAATGEHVILATSRKLTHNAYERDRRKRLNGLYSSLRALLPHANLQKKLSIPSTVSYVLQYIPELQKQVRRLTRRREEILLTITRHENRRITENKHNPRYPVVSAVRIGDREVMVQICSFNRALHGSISKLLTRLEGEGLRLLHASTSTLDAGRISCNLHLQVKNVTNGESQIFSRNLENIVMEELRKCWK